MSIMMIKDIYLFHPQQEKGKHVSFAPGKNVMTSASLDGNNVGKTTILKSIYHTLGADCYFDTMWPKKEIISVVIADIDGVEYQFYRHDRLHRVYQQGILLFQTDHKHALGKFMAEEFELAVFLPNRTGQELELAPPAYSYVLNYLDNPEGPKFTSFDKMGEYSSVKDIIIYNHLGAFDGHYYQLKRQHEQLSAAKSRAEEKLNLLQGMISRINSEILDADYSTNLDALQHEVDSISRTYRQLVATLSKIKKSIVELSNKRIQLQQQLDELHREQKSATSDMVRINATHRCPHCDAQIDDLVRFRAIGYNQQAALIIMHDEISKQLLDLENRLNSLQKDYSEKLEAVNQYKLQLRQAKGYSDDLIKQEGAIQIRDQFVSEADELYRSIEGYKEQLKTLAKDLKEYMKKIKEVNDEYYSLMKAALARFTLQEVADEKIQKIASSFTATDNNQRVATLIWLYTLLRLKATHNPNALVLPILVDSPSYGELDDTKEHVLWEFLFDLPTPGAQLIITKLDFSEEMQKQYSIDKVIKFTNPKYNLLNSEDYAAHLGMLQSLQSRAVPE